MKGNKVPFLIAIAALCWIVLICFQAKWIMDSRSLIEEQFDQKVSLALCAAVSSLDTTKDMSCMPTGLFVEEVGCKPSVVRAPENTATYDTEGLDAAVAEALDFYDIDLAYEITVAQSSNGSSADPNCDPASPYCCAINPFQEAESPVMSISFPGKNAYLLDKIWWMLATSIFILLFILVVFILALRALIHQQRISQWNVDFFNNMAHEFRTPLTNISLAMQRLVKRNPELKDDPYVDVVRNEDAKLGAQIDRVLGIAALDHGGPYLKTQKVDLRDLLELTVSDMDLAIQAANADVRLHLPDSPTWVDGDKFHLTRAFRNLLDNALKYTDTTPVIDIRVEPRGKSVAVTFEDNGIGISSQNQELIFKKFHRIPKGNRHDQKGFGLGLSYVKMIIEDHSGTIRALQRAQRGSQFELIFPLI